MGVAPDVNLRPDTTQLLEVTHPKCTMSYDWSIESFDKSDSSASNDTSLEEVGDSSKETCHNNSKMDLRSRDSQISKLNATLERADISMRELSHVSNSDEKIENLLKEESPLRSTRKKLK